MSIKEAAVNFKLVFYIKSKCKHIGQILEIIKSNLMQELAKLDTETEIELNCVFDKSEDLSEPIDKYHVMLALKTLWMEDDQCSRNCFGCQFENQCNRLDKMLEKLFGSNGN